VDHPLAIHVREVLSLESCFMKVLIDQPQIRQGIAQLGERLNREYGQGPITVVAIMTGSLVMLADLIRCLEMPLRIRFALLPTVEELLQGNCMSKS
jgi:hypoxanthine-guanine phosphoribosyltransferase